MKDFKDKVAVITGAASGIGFGIAKNAIKQGMKVVIADIEEEALSSAQDKLRNFGDNIIAVPTDVSKADSLERLAQETLETFGKVHLLCNNAGIFIRGVLWEMSLEEWDWVVNVNLWGVIHGIRTFIPIMLNQDENCHIINVSSTAGLISSQHYDGIYTLTKQGVVAISEALSNELDALKTLMIQSSDLLKPSGRLVVISYHSLEDRLVKNYLKYNNFKGEVNIDLFGKQYKEFNEISKKVIVPNDEEININNRARSAKLRIAERI